MPPSLPATGGTVRLTDRRKVAQPAFDIVAVASSAGGIVALTELLAALPADFPAAVVCVQHLDPRHRSLMPHIMSRRCKLPVVEAENGMTVDAGRVHLAPPDGHLLVNRDITITLTHTELVNFVRPSADLMFESVAASYGDRAIAVVLTGAGRDGAMGVAAIKKKGGTVIVQDEASSEFFGMPSAAIRTGTVDFVLSLGEIGGAVTTLVCGEAPD